MHAALSQHTSRGQCGTGLQSRLAEFTLFLPHQSPIVYRPLHWNAMSNRSLKHIVKKNPANEHNHSSASFFLSFSVNSAKTSLTGSSINARPPGVSRILWFKVHSAFWLGLEEELHDAHTHTRRCISTYVVHVVKFKTRLSCSHVPPAWTRAPKSFG